MKIAIVNNTVPFVRGGAEVLADALCDQLRRAGHPTDLVRLPFSWEPPEHVADGMLAAALTRVPNVDRVIAFKFPAYLVPHDDKVIWLLHQFRQFYELWEDPGGNVSEADRRRAEIRSMVHHADDDCFRGATRLFAGSAVSAARLYRFNGFVAEELFAPLPDPGSFRNLQTGEYIFAGGRINGFKRQLLAVEAMRHTRTRVVLVVAGAPETPYDLALLQRAREESGCAERIIIIPEFIQEHHKAELVNRSLACVYCPIDEESYGYVTLEGAQASKALITVTDSGGITNLVIDGRSGYVCAPEPVELARAFDALYDHPDEAEELGRGAHERMLELKISWDHVVERLTCP